MTRPGARWFGPGLGLKYDNCVAGRAGPGHTFCGPGRPGPGPHNSVCGPGPGRVCTTAAGPGRAWASNHICGPGLGLNFRPVQGPIGYREVMVDWARFLIMCLEKVQEAFLRKRVKQFFLEHFFVLITNKLFANLDFA